MARHAQDRVSKMRISEGFATVFMDSASLVSFPDVKTDLLVLLGD